MKETKKNSAESKRNQFIADYTIDALVAEVVMGMDTLQIARKISSHYCLKNRDIKGNQNNDPF